MSTNLEKKNKNLEKDINHLGLTLPDIARETRVELTGRLDRVGMQEIEVPVRLSAPKVGNKYQRSTDESKDHGSDLDESSFLTPARVNAFVSLDDPQAKGIHMSRLYLQLQEGLTSKVFSFALLKELLEKFIESHVSLSQSSAIEVAFDYMVERPALVSANVGWRKYPLIFGATFDKGHLYFDLQFTITYSSTCPCSAALARKLIQDHFLKEFTTEQVSRNDVHHWLSSTQGILATPHSQRSLARIQIRFTEESLFQSSFEWIEMINRLEKSLGTPVQAAVKREDEQEFALLNGQNLMFCEDAARKLKNAISSINKIDDYRIEVSHLESLHPHNAVSIVTKGVEGGLKP